MEVAAYGQNLGMGVGKRRGLEQSGLVYGQQQICTSGIASGMG